MSTLRTTTLAKQDNSASVPVDTVINGTAKAWVNFNGTGTVAIRQAFNVSSITDLSTGRYAVNFTTTMPDTNYAAFFTVTDDDTAARFSYESGTFGGYRTNSHVTLYSYAPGVGVQDAQGIYVVIFR